MTTLPTIVAASPLNASDDSRQAFTPRQTETRSFTLGNTPVNFDFMNSLDFTIEYRVQSRNDDIVGLRVRIVNGATILAASNSGGTFFSVNPTVTNTSDFTDGPNSFPYVNTGASKATWDGASVEIEQTYNQTMGPDDAFLEIDYFELTGDYTATAILGTGALDAPAASLSGTGEREVVGSGALNFPSGTVLAAVGIAGRGDPIVEVTWLQSELPIPPPTAPDIIRPDGDSALNGWTDNNGGTTDIYQSIDEVVADDTDYIKSPNNPSGEIYKVSLADVGNGFDPNDFQRVQFRFRKTGTADMQLTVRLVEGTTTRASWVITNVPGHETDAERVLTPAQRASITDYNNLFLEFEAEVL